MNPQRLILISADEHIAMRCESMHDAISAGRTNITPEPAISAHCPFCNITVMIVKDEK